MATIARNPAQAAGDKFDLIIVGGGIYGAMLMLESVRSGLKPLLLEKSDFGSSTSFNNLRIVHGGLRYLQTLHLSRFRESVVERRWFLKTFPEFVCPLPCLMPLYGGLTRNRMVLRAALAANDWLGRARNDGIGADRQLPDGEVLSVEETVRRFPGVRTHNLRGSAVWYDAVMPNSHRLQIEVLRWCVAAGGTALNYVEATDLVKQGRKVAGIVATDHIGHRQHQFSAKIVINAAGPDARALSVRFGSDQPALFNPSLAWNVLLNRPSLSDGAVAIQPPARNSRVYFAHSLYGKLLLGTGHATLKAGAPPAVDLEQLQQMIEDVNLAVPGLQLRTDEVTRIFAGQLPVKRPGTVRLSDTPLIVDHRQNNGPDGLFSISGVKYTTSRSTAAALIAALPSAGRPKSAIGLPDRPKTNTYLLHPGACPDREERLRRAKRLVADEAPQTLEDLLIRRSNLASDPDAALEIAEDVSAAFNWDDHERKQQIGRLDSSLHSASTPANS